VAFGRNCREHVGDQFAIVESEAKIVGGRYCFGDYDLAIITDVPNNESMAEAQ
jgi:hypothetical protein